MSWQRDGWSATHRIGVVTPHADLGPESEFRAMAPEGVGIHAARARFVAMRPGGAMSPTIAEDAASSFADPPHVDDAVELLAAAPLHAIAYGFTSSSYMRGADDDAVLKRRLETRSRGIPVIITCSAATDALRTLGARSLALVDPPWFSTTLDSAGAAYFTNAGFDVVFNAPAGLPSGQQLITPESLFDWIRANVPTSVDAIFVGGNGFRAVGVINRVEEELGVAMLTANSAALWASMRAAKCNLPVNDYGRIFER